MKCKLIVAIAALLTVLNASKIATKRIKNSNYTAELARIIGGNTAEMGTAPYQVSLQNSFEHFCAGAIIAPQWIITAAHCLINIYPSDVTVLAGTQDLTDDSTGVSYNVKRFYIHCNFENPNLSNDIALLLLESAMVLNEKTQSIDLPTAALQNGAQVILTGWGSEEFLGESPDRLKVISLNYMPYKDCKLAHHNSESVDVGHICTFTQRGEGACHGDSGGPLVSNGVLVGIVNWGEPCAIGYPDVYANVLFYLDWIRTILSGNRRCNLHALLKENK